MATSILKGLGVEVPAEDLATVQKDPLFEKINGLRAYRSKEWMKHIGYNREKLVNPQALGDTEKEVEKRQAEIVGLLKKPR